MTIQKPDYWEQAIKELSETDPVMKTLIDAYKGETLQSRGDAFSSLARSIVGQQISVAAAATVWNRLEQAVTAMTPPAILATGEDTLRAAGLSRQKVSYLKHIAENFDNGTVDITRYPLMSDEEIICDLTQLKGVGRWTAEMFSIFFLLRPNIYPTDDIGLQKAIIKHYDTKDILSKKLITKLGDTWQPWRSVATWYLWRSLDPIPVEY